MKTKDSPLYFHCPFCEPFRFNFDAMRAEAGDNLKKLLEVEKRLFLSTEDLKIQHTEFVQVGKEGTMFFASCFQIALNLLSGSKIQLAMDTGLWAGVVTTSHCTEVEEESCVFSNSAMWYCGKETAEEQLVMCVGKRKEDAKNEMCDPTINIYGTVTCFVSLLLGKKRSEWTDLQHVFMCLFPDVLALELLKTGLCN